VDANWVDKANQTEIPLAGGDVTEGVVRVGDTVRRPRGRWDEGVGDMIKRREAWLDRHAATLTAALTAP
jgi:hypothetical protein